MLEINKIHLGDSYELIKQIDDNSIDCIYTDIPYLYSFNKTTSKNSASELNKRIIKNSNSLVDIEINKGIDYSIFHDFIRIMKKINVFVWCSKDQILDILNWFNRNADCSYNILVWIKTNPTPMCNGNWLPDIEYCLHFNKGIRLNDGYELKSKWFISSINKQDKDLFDHPTIKPLPLVKRHLLHTTQENDIVLDCFSGSGTTCVAAKELNRRFIGIEIDERYHKISVDRLNGITANGQTSIFTDFESEEQQ